MIQLSDKIETDKTMVKELELFVNQHSLKTELKFQLEKPMAKKTLRFIHRRLKESGIHMLYVEDCYLKKATIFLTKEKEG